MKVMTDSEIQKDTEQEKKAKAKTSTARSLGQEARARSPSFSTSAKQESDDDLDQAEDIAFPTELRRYQSTPGAFHLGGVNQSNGNDENEPCDEEGEHDVDIEATREQSHNAVEGPLISAHLVEEDEIVLEAQANVKPAVLAHADPLPARKYSKYRICYLCMALAGIVALAVGLSLALMSKKNKNNNTSPHLSFEDLWQRAEFQSNHAVFWGLYSTCYETTTPSLNVSCHEVVQVESTLNSTCERQDANTMTCTMDASSVKAGVLFACAGHEDHILRGSAHLLPISCHNEMDSKNSSLITFMSMGRFCPDHNDMKGGSGKGGDGTGGHGKRHPTSDDFALDE